MSNYDQNESIDLAQWSDVYDSHEIDESSDFESLPDGRYQCQVSAVQLTRSKSNDNPMLAWELTVLGPRYAGRKIWRNNMMMTPENIRWLKQDLWKCGLKLEKITELPDRLDELLNVRLEVTLKTRKGIQNVFLNKLLTGKGEPRHSDEKRNAADAAVYNDDVPF